MDKATFEKLITSNNKISNTDAILLENLLEAFPYCQSAHLLIAKDCQQKKSMLYPKKLRKASTYILDRKVLHYFVTENESVIFKNNQTSIPTSKSLIEDIEDTIREVKANKERALSQIKNSEKPNKVEFSHVIQSEKHKTILSTSETRLGDEIICSESKTTLEMFLAFLNDEDPILKTDKTPKQDEIINNFIKTEPKITRSISSTIITETTSDLSKTSTELKTELITENYALILLKQNKIEKAKEIYKKMMLKYPNKSAYFESKLNEI